MGDFKDSIYGNNPETRSFIDNLYGSGTKDYSTGANTDTEYEFVSSYEEKPHKKKKKKMSKNSKIALLVCITIILSGAFGFAGAAVYNGVFDGSAGGGNSISRTDGYTLEDATGSSLTVSEIVEKSADSVVEIVTESVATDSWMMQYITEGAGSGVIIDSDGYIMTNNHVISGARKITVTLRNGDEYEAKLVGTDSTNDVAVIKINPDGKELTAATYGNSDQLVVGEMAVAIGNPLGQLGGTVSTGIVSALNRDITIDGQEMNLLQTDASINPGNSGGGLFNQYGQLIGLVVAKSSGSDVEGLGFAIPVNTAADVAQQIIKAGGNVNSQKASGNAVIGVTVANLQSRELAQEYGFDTPGVYVSAISSINAQEAGFQIGDRIAKADGKKISDYDDLSAVLKKHSPGDTISVVVERNNEKVTLKTTLTASSETAN